MTLIPQNAKELKTCIDCICRFENLRKLTLIFQTSKMKEPIDDYLSLIGQKCNKLLKLNLIIDDSVPISDRFFDVFSQFKAIKKLGIHLNKRNGSIKGSVECFKLCKQLIDIDITYDELSEDFFVNIASFVPKLQLLYVSTGHGFSDSFINPF